MSNKAFYKQTTLPDLTSGETLTPATTPQKIGPYKIESLLSKGGMSILYLGIHPETKATVAIKVLSPSYVSHPEFVERFLKEAHIIGISNHPNIVKLFGQGEWEGGLYIAMEFIRGISLSQFIVQQSLSLKRCIDIILQVSYALLHLHTHGVIHRDLKPENILITEEGEIKVIDFGIAQLHEEAGLPSVEQVLGTPSYMAPEQKENAAKATYASDIYSLGVITYELVIGKLSYGVIDLSLLPKGLKKIIGKALAISLEERYQDIVDYISDLSQYLKSGELEKDRPGSDQVKEVIETLQKTSLALSPISVPDWSQFEIGLAKHKGPGQMGIYYDFYKFPNNIYGVLLVEAAASGVEASVFIAGLRGTLRTLIHEKTELTQSPFRLLSLITALNQLVLEDSVKQSFALSFVLLDPLRDQLSFISCGNGRLVHIPNTGSNLRFLESNNPALGLQAQIEFAETINNWNIGETLILHSFETFFTKEEPSVKSDIESAFNLAVSEFALLSAQRQAEGILRRMLSLPIPSLMRAPKVVISLRRLS